MRRIKQNNNFFYSENEGREQSSTRFVNPPNQQRRNLGGKKTNIVENPNFSNFRTPLKPTNRNQHSRSHSSMRPQRFKPFPNNHFFSTPNRKVKTVQFQKTPIGLRKSKSEQARRKRKPFPENIMPPPNVSNGVSHQEFQESEFEQIPEVETYERGKRFDLEEIEEVSYPVFDIQRNKYVKKKFTDDDLFDGPEREDKRTIRLMIEDNEKAILVDPDGTVSGIEIDLDDINIDDEIFGDVNGLLENNFETM